MLTSLSVPGGLAALEAEDFDPLVYLESSLETVSIDLLEDLLRAAKTEVTRVLTSTVNEHYPELVALGRALEEVHNRESAEVAASIDLLSESVAELQNVARPLQSGLEGLVAERQQLTAEQRTHELGLEADFVHQELEAAVSALSPTSSPLQLELSARICHQALRARLVREQQSEALDRHRQTIVDLLTEGVKSVSLRRESANQFSCLWRAAALLGETPRVIRVLGEMVVHDMPRASGDALACFEKCLTWTRCHYLDATSDFGGLYTDFSSAGKDSCSTLLALRCAALPAVREALSRYPGVQNPNEERTFWISYSLTRGFLKQALAFERTLCPRLLAPTSVRVELLELESAWPTSVGVSIAITEAMARAAAARDKPIHKPSLRFVSWTDRVTGATTQTRHSCWFTSGSVLGEVLSMLNSKADDGKSLFSSCIPRVIRGCCEMLNDERHWLETLESHDPVVLSRWHADAMVLAATLAEGGDVESGVAELLDHAADDFNIVKAPIRALAASFEPTLEALSARIVQVLAEPPTKALEAAHAIPKLYLLTGRPAPTKPSPYAVTLLDAMRTFIVAVSEEPIVPQAVLTRWIQDSVEIVVAAAVRAVAAVDETASKHDRSQKRLAGAEQGVLRIRQQMKLDVAAMADAVEGVAGDVRGLARLKALQDKFV